MTYSENCSKKIIEEADKHAINICKKIHNFIKNKISVYAKESIYSQTFFHAGDLNIGVNVKDIITKDEFFYIKYALKKWDEYKENCDDDLLKNDNIHICINTMYEPYELFCLYFTITI